MLKTFNRILVVILVTSLFFACRSEGQKDTYRHPAEFEAHASTGFVWSTDYYGIVPDLAAKISQYDPVTIFLEKEQQNREPVVQSLMQRGARLDRISFMDMAMDYDNIWVRDFGPTFLTRPKGEKKLVNFRYFWTDMAFTREYAGLNDLPVSQSALNSSGGSREVNGKGTLLLCEMHERETNPELSLEEMEAEMKKALGVKKVIWLKKGLPQDDLITSGPISGDIYPKGVHGHVDEFCRFADESTILLYTVSQEEAASNPIFAEAKRRMDENMRILSAATDQDGKKFRVLRVPAAPLLVHDRRKEAPGQIVASVSTYLNFIISNSMVLLPTYMGPDNSTPSLMKKEEEVENIFRQAFPDRELVKVRADTLNYFSGGFHCISIHLDPLRKRSSQK